MLERFLNVGLPEGLPKVTIPATIKEYSPGSGFMLQDKQRTKVRHYQYIAIDHATRARVLKIYERHTQKMRLISLIIFLNFFFSLFILFKQIMVMSFSHNFIGIVRA